MTKILIILLALSIGINIYFIQVETIVVDNFEDEMLPIDQVSIAQSSIAPNCPKEKIVYKCPDNASKNDHKTGQLLPTKRIHPFSQKHENVETEEMLSYDKFHQQWYEKVNDFFELELRLPQDKIVSYHDLKSLRTQELDKLLSEKIQEHVREFGEQNAYSLSSKDTIELGKLNLKYEKRLLDLLGTQNMKEYQNFKQSYNQASQKTHMMIDF